MPDFEIHPSAQENFNSKVAQLVSKITKIPREHASTATFNTDLHIAATLREADMVGELKEYLTDYKGDFIGRFFIFGTDRFGLTGEDHAELVRIAEVIQDLRPFRNSLSNAFIQETMFSWMRAQYTGVPVDNSFCDTLKNEASKVVKSITVFVPIANTVIEEAFEFCGATFRTLTKTMVDELLTVKPATTRIQEKNISEWIEGFRKDFQGYAVVEANLICEPDFASSLAISIASRAADLLGIYSGRAAIPGVKCASKIKGTENLAHYTTITRTQEGRVNINQGMLDMASVNTWHISKAHLETFSKCGLRVISEIATKYEITKFEKAILNMASIYSKAAFTSDPLEKLVYTLSALESMLLKNDSESIIQNLSERVAFLTATAINERKKVIKNIRAVYNLRSNYIHHGNNSIDLAEMAVFFRSAWLCYICVIANSGKFNTKEDFIEGLEDLKLSGGVRADLTR